MTTNNAAISVTNLKKHFGTFTAVDGISFDVPKGSVLGVLGPNGAGKTTTVRMLTTLLRPDEGVVTIAGFDLTKDPDEVKKRIGLTGQYAAVDENLTGFENLVMIGQLHRMSLKNAREKAVELLSNFGLTDAGHKSLKTYSGGMRRRLDLAASLVGDPEILFLDEPTTGLDPKSRLDLWEILRGLTAKGTTILLTTQYLEEADALADTIIMIDHGKIVAQGTSDELKEASGGDVLELRIGNPDRNEEVLGLIASAGTGSPTVADDGMITLPVKARTASLLEVLRRLDAANMNIIDIALRRPTLDEIFLDVTGDRH